MAAEAKIFLEQNNESVLFSSSSLSSLEAKFPPATSFLENLLKKLKINRGHIFREGVSHKSVDLSEKYIFFFEPRGCVARQERGRGMKNPLN